MAIIANAAIVDTEANAGIAGIDVAVIITALAMMALKSRAV